MTGLTTSATDYLMRAHAINVVGAISAAVALLHEQLVSDGVHVGGVTVAGNIAPDTAFAPDLIADAFWDLHAEPAGSWNVEKIFDGE